MLSAQRGDHRPGETLGDDLLAGVVEVKVLPSVMPGLAGRHQVVAPGEPVFGDRVNEWDTGFVGGATDHVAGGQDHVTPKMKSDTKF